MFEAAACGTPLLSDQWRGLDEFFVDGEEILLVNSTADVLAAMKLPDAELARFAARARERTLDEHTGLRRAQQMLDAFADAKSQRREHSANAPAEMTAEVAS